MNSAASAIMVAEEEAAALLVEHTREALAESEANVGSYLEQYELLVSSFVGNRCGTAVLTALSLYSDSSVSTISSCCTPAVILVHPFPLMV
jgi:hypothetical protein